MSGNNGTTSIPPFTNTRTTTPIPSTSETTITSTVVTQQSGTTSTQTITSVFTPSSTSSPSASTSTNAAALQTGDTSGDDGGLSTPATIAIAVVIPIVVIALLAVAGIFLWRRRKAKKDEAELRRKEVEDYNYNPNNDPTLPAVALGSEMAEDSAGYRGWGSTMRSTRKGSTTLSNGLTAGTFSDNGSSPIGAYAHSPNAPSEGASADPLTGGGQRDTLDSEGISALGAGPVAGTNRGADVHRGPSNASSSYSAANRSEGSDGGGSVPKDFYGDGNTNYYTGQTGPYEAHNGYAGGSPIVQDVSARRNTRIESPVVSPPQGSAGISQNF